MTAAENHRQRGMGNTSRRRVLQIAAGLTTLGLASATPTVRRWRWSGSALGAVAAIELHDVDRARAIRLVELAVGEIGRLEAIFSLQRLNSALSRLNRDGHLAGPPLELAAVFETAATLSQLSCGAFDVTVQPLWRLHADAAAAGTGPDGRLVERTLARVGWERVDYGRRSIAFGRPGMAATLNGIAQGYITDRIALLCRDAGLDQVFVDLGEQRVSGGRPPRRPWRIGTPVGTVALGEGALAVSATYPGVARPNLISPSSGLPVMGPRCMVVTAPSAQLADGASTALAVCAPDAAHGLRKRLAPLGVAVLERPTSLPDLPPVPS